MRDDALPVGRLALAGLAILLVVAIAIATVLTLLHRRGLPPGGVPVARPADVPASQPALQTAPQQDLAAYRRDQSAALARADADHVPIALAMARVAAGSASSASAPEAQP